MSAYIRLKLPRSVHPIQLLHIWNAFIGIILVGLLIGVATNVRSFISNGSSLAGFGNFNLFAFPSTYVYMLIPAVCGLVYSLILAFDPSPSYSAWNPSKTLISTLTCMAGTLFLGSLLPLVPGADVITDPDPSIRCTWADFMSWRTIYNNPDIYPWVTNMDTACSCLRAADAFNWIFLIGWLAIVILYSRVHYHRRRQLHANVSEKKIPMQAIIKTKLEQ